MDNKRYWLRGGIITAVIFIIAYGFVHFMEYYSGMCIDDTCGPLTIPFYLLAFIAFLPRYIGSMFFQLPLPFSILGLNYLMSNFILNLLCWVIVGMVAGYIYGKIKNRNKIV